MSAYVCRVHAIETNHRGTCVYCAAERQQRSNARTQHRRMIRLAREGRRITSNGTQ